MGPRPTRNTAVLDLGPRCVAMLPALYSGRQHAIEGSSLISNVIYVSKISAGQHAIIDGNNDGVLLEIKFWVSDCARHPAFSVHVTAPSWWTVKMYLLALNIAIKRAKSIVPHRVASSWGDTVASGFISINTVHFLYRGTEQQLLSIIHSHGGISRVKGGADTDFI
jgi:hypothetical protein